jgi:hypothetical protein
MSDFIDGVSRRVMTRQPCLTSSCRLLDNVSWKSHIRDISPLGIGLICEGEVQVGARLNLQLSRSVSGIQFALQARIVHVEKREDGRWLVGCAFDRRLPDVLVTMVA